MKKPWTTLGLGLILLGGTAHQARSQGSPRVLATWAAGPFEVRVAFEGKADPRLPEGLVGRSIAFEEPGVTDRRGTLRIAAARLDDGGSTLVLTTDPHPRAGRYSLNAPGLSFSYGLTGIEAEWREGKGDGDDPPRWKGWWPTFDPETARRSVGTAGAFAGAWEALEKPGRLTLTGLLTLPEGAFKVRVRANRPTSPTLDALEPAESGEKPGDAAVFEVEALGLPALLSLTVPTGAGPPPLTILVTAQPSDESSKERPVGASDTLLPWVPPAPSAPPQLVKVPDFSKGDPAVGAGVFAGAESKCATCHKIRGQGGEVGPDLSDLVGRDPERVYRDVIEPSARIHPDFVSYTLALKDGRVFAGIVRAEGADALRVVDAEGKGTTLPRGEIEEFRPSVTSIMPVGLAGSIGDDKLVDLIAYLTRPAAGR